MYLLIILYLMAVRTQQENLRERCSTNDGIKVLLSFRVASLMCAPAFLISLLERTDWKNQIAPSNVSFGMEYCALSSISLLLIRNRK